jgi:hypothetical protein
MFKVEIRLQLYVFLAILLQEKSLVEMEGKTGITYLKKECFQPSSSIKKNIDCSYVVAHSGHLWHVCPNVDIIMSFAFLTYFISNSTTDIQNG